MTTRHYTRDPKNGRPVNVTAESFVRHGKTVYMITSHGHPVGFAQYQHDGMWRGYEDDGLLDVNLYHSEASYLGTVAIALADKACSLAKAA